MDGYPSCFLSTGYWHERSASAYVLGMDVDTGLLTTYGDGDVHDIGLEYYHVMWDACFQGFGVARFGKLVSAQSRTEKLIKPFLTLTPYLDRSLVLVLFPEEWVGGSQKS